DRELFHHFVDRHTVLEVLEDDGHWGPSPLEHPGPADLARNAFNGRALGPIERCHAGPPSLQITAKCRGRHAGSSCGSKTIDLESSSHFHGSSRSRKPAMPFFVIAASSFSSSGSTDVKLRHDLPCIRFRSAGDRLSRSELSVYSGMRW